MDAPDARFCSLCDVQFVNKDVIDVKLHSELRSAAIVMGRAFQVLQIQGFGLPPVNEAKTSFYEAVAAELTKDAHCRLTDLHILKGNGVLHFPLKLLTEQLTDF
jgi:hypothetical protein